MGHFNNKKKQKKRSFREKRLVCRCVWQNVVSRSALQFKGNSQHDAQEFLLWLLDRVHEDLNHIAHPDIRPHRKVTRTAPTGVDLCKS